MKNKTPPLLPCFPSIRVFPNVPALYERINYLPVPSTCRMCTIDEEVNGRPDVSSLLSNSVSPFLSASVPPGGQVSILDRLLDSFLLGNTPWCTSVLVGVASVHAATASVGDEGKKSPPRAPTPTPPASAGTTRPPRSGGSSGGGSGGSGGGVVVVDDDGYLAGGVIAMSDVIRRGLLGLAASGSNRGAASKADGRQRASSSLGGRSGGGGGSNDSTGGGGGGGGGSDVGDGGVSGDDDDPMAAALSLHLLRRMLQAGGADTRAVAASVGIPTEGARKRGEKKVRWQPPLQMGRKGDGRMALYGDDPENSTAEGGAWAEGDEEGEGGGADQGGRVGDADGGVRLAPPLTPALEVAVRLLADGYNVAISLQVGLASYRLMVSYLFWIVSFLGRIPRWSHCVWVVPFADHAFSGWMFFFVLYILGSFLFGSCLFRGIWLRDGHGARVLVLLAWR